MVASVAKSIAKMLLRRSAHPASHPMLRLSALAVAAVAVAGCDDSDVIALRITVEQHGGGTILINSVQVPETAGPVERATNGVQWSQRVNLVAASGSFSDLSALRVEDLAFHQGSTGTGEGFVQVTIPLGKAAKWPGVLAAAEPADLADASLALDPSGKVTIGRKFKIMMTLPGRVVAQGTRPETRQAKMKTLDAVAAGDDDVDAENENRVASLVLPLGLARAASGNLTWHVMWSR